MRTTTPAVVRAVRKVRIDGSCWVFTGANNGHGYGVIGVGSKADGTRRMAYVHRVTYEHHRGPIPEGLVLDHLCRVRACCNPWHLEPVTTRENLYRGEGRTARGQWTHCHRGHPFDEANTQWRANGTRGCRACAREHEKKRVRR